MGGVTEPELRRAVDLSTFKEASRQARNHVEPDACEDENMAPRAADRVGRALELRESKACRPLVEKIGAEMEGAVVTRACDSMRRARITEGANVDDVQSGRSVGHAYARLSFWPDGNGDDAAVVAGPGHEFVSFVGESQRDHPVEVEVVSLEPFARKLPILEFNNQESPGADWRNDPPASRRSHAVRVTPQSSK